LTHTSAHEALTVPYPEHTPAPVCAVTVPH
jgi:hypothetical protein